MAITFNCPCGKVLSSRDEDAGLKAICPNCGRRVVVPGQIQVPEDSGAQLRKLLLRFDAWMHRQHRKIFIASILLAIAIGSGLFGYKKWKAHQLETQPVSPTIVEPISKTITLDPDADPENWRTSFDSFAVAAKDAITKNEIYVKEKFTNEEIDWVVTFDDFLQRQALYFREAEPLRKADYGILVWALVLPSQVDAAEELTPGQRIRLKGKIGPIVSSRSQEHPLGYYTIRPVECSIEMLRDPVMETAKTHDPDR